MDLQALVKALRDQPSWDQKQFIQELAGHMGPTARTRDERIVRLGDDAAAVERGDSYILTASELILPGLVENQPELAGRSAILANVNDVYAMGGRPIGVQDIMLSDSAGHVDRLREGLEEGCRRYAVPILGGHLTRDDSSPVLGASILGEAESLLSCDRVEPGQQLLMATHLDGHFKTDHAFWSCTAHRSNREIQDDLDLLPQIAEKGLNVAAKDISMAGLIGTLLMLLEPTSSGAVIDLNAVPTPEEAQGRRLDWLTAFPSYGFVLAVPPESVDRVQSRFRDRSIVCDLIGEVQNDTTVELTVSSDRETVWDFNDSAFTGFTDGSG